MWHNRAMSHQYQKQYQELFNRNKVRFLSGLSFGIGFLDALLLYILSSYFIQVAGEENIGWFYFFAFALVLWWLIRLQPLVRRFGSARLLLFLLTNLIALSVILSLDGPSWFGAGLLLFFMVCSNLVWSVMDVLVEDFSADHVSGRVRGFYLTVLNLGLLMAPWLSTKVLSQFGYAGVFSLLTFGYTLVFLAALLGLRSHKTKPLVRISFSTTLIKAWKNRNIRIIYLLSWMLEFFYAIMIVYAPILLIEQQLDWQDIGIVFTIMLLPFVLIQYPLGILADKKYGERELLFLSLVIMGIATLFFAMSHHLSLVGWGAILFLTRVGAAALEVLRDSFFYKQIGPQDTDMVAFFRTARPVANIVGAGMAVLFLAYWDTPSLFLLVGELSLLFAGSSLFLKDTQPTA